MKSIDPETRTKMAKSFAICFIFFAAPAIQLMFFERLMVPLGLATMLVLPSLFSLLPLIVAMNQKTADKRLQNRSQWREAYRVSPESHLLHLND